MFDELKKDFETTEDEKKKLRVLSERGEWKVFQGMVERYIIKKSFDLLSGTERERGKAEEELYAVRGFVRFWSIITGRVNRKENDEEKKDTTGN